MFIQHGQYPPVSRCSSFLRVHWLQVPWPKGKSGFFTSELYHPFLPVWTVQAISRHFGTLKLPFHFQSIKKNYLAMCAYLYVHHTATCMFKYLNVFTDEKEGRILEQQNHWRRSRIRLLGDGKVKLSLDVHLFRWPFCPQNFTQISQDSLERNTQALKVTGIGGVLWWKRGASGSLAIVECEKSSGGAPAEQQGYGTFEETARGMAAWGHHHSPLECWIKTRRLRLDDKQAV